MQMASVNIVQKLAKFTNHAVKAISPSTIFWEEGERIATEGDNSSGVVEEHQSKELSNTNSNVLFPKIKNGSATLA